MYLRLVESDLPKYPLILAGPILRAVTKDSVTVWLALKEANSVFLSIKVSPAATPIVTGFTHTTQIGTHLHLAVVTAYKKDAFQPGQVYLYTLEFGGGKSLTTPGVFSKSGDISSICYTKAAKPLLLPSFVVPPDDWRQLHFLHGSCRMLHGQGADAMLAVDQAIFEKANTTESPGRPQVLFLTGDQIYADDVSAALLRIIMDVGDVLFSGYTYAESFGIEKETELKGPRHRLKIAKEHCHFTSEDSSMENHLLYFREFAVMYLMAWSDVFWPAAADDYPTWEQSGQALPPLRPWPQFFERTYLQDQVLPCLNSSAIQGRVRRALANISTYMIMDDHEVADDAFINVKWCAEVLGSKVGRQVVRNALKAYAVFQAWGNTPEQFEGIDTPGARLLALLEKGKDADTKEIDLRLAIPPQEHIFEPSIWDGKIDGSGKIPNLDAPLRGYVGEGGVTLYKYTKEEKAAGRTPYLVWYYTLNRPTYQFVVNDTRTWRAYPGNRLEPHGNFHAEYPCIPISDEGLRRQVDEGAKPPTAVTEPFVTFVINGLAPFDVPTLEWVREQGMISLRYFLDVEGWSSHPVALERFLARWVTRDLKRPSPTRRVVILSGDIHHSYAAKLTYYAKKPIGGTGPCWGVFALLTASAFKKEDIKTRALHGQVINHRALHNNGYEALGWLNVNDRDRRHFFGWLKPPGEGVAMGTLVDYGTLSLSPPSKPLMYPGVMCFETALHDQHKRKFLVPNSELRFDDEVSDWRYRLDYLDGKSRREVDLTGKQLPNPGKAALAGALHEGRKAIFEYGPKTGFGAQIVGKNNLGDIYFEVIDHDAYIVQGNWWYLNDRDAKTLGEHTYFPVRFEPNSFAVKYPPQPL